MFPFRNESIPEFIGEFGYSDDLDANEKMMSDKFGQEINKEMEALDLEEDEFIQEYMKKRMQEMVEASVIQRKHFGHVFALQDGEAFLSTVDCPETKSDLIMVLISESVNSICKVMENCWATLAKDYSYVKFCKIQVNFEDFYMMR